MELRDKTIILKELINCQRPCIGNDKKLKKSDIKRISNYITESIFDDHNCTLWQGYVTNKNNKKKGSYVNFYFNKKKVALHRLLYLNYVGDLDSHEYLKFTCNNQGNCCNIHHLSKFKYSLTTLKPKKNQTIYHDRDKLEVSFD